MIRGQLLKLAAVQPSEITKVAGILRRIKNWFQGMTNSDIKENQNALREETKELSDKLPEFYENVRLLLQAIQDMDYIAYRSLLPTLQEQALILSVKVKEVAGTAKKIEKQYRTSYTAEEHKEQYPKLLDETKEYLGQHRPLHDVPFGTVNKPLMEFKWFQQFSPDNVVIREPVWQSFVAKLMKIIPLDQKEEAKEIIKNPNVKDILKTAILNGELVDYIIPDVRGGFKERKFAENMALVRTAPFQFPGLNLSFTATISLLDQASAKEPSPHLIWAETRSVKNPIITSSRARLSLMKRLAGVNPQAAKDLPKEFWTQYVEMCRRLSAKPIDLAHVLYSESAFDHAAVNIQNGRPVAKGLCQLLWKTADKLGMTKPQWDDMEKMDAIQQLQWVERYFKAAGQLRGGDEWTSPTELYVALAAPAYLKNADSPSAQLYSKYKEDGSINPNYQQNKGLDRDNKGYISPSDLTVSVSRPLPSFIEEAITSAASASSNTGVPFISPPSTPANDHDALLNQLFAAPSITEIVKKGTRMTYWISIHNHPFPRTINKMAKVLLEGIVHTDISIERDVVKIATTNHHDNYLAIREGIEFIKNIVNEPFNYTIIMEKV